MSVNNTVDQTTKKTEIKSVVIKNTTSPEEKRHGSMNWIIVCNVKEILKFDLSKNLRISYGDAVSEEGKRIKSRNAIHKSIYRSFEENPQRFIQRSSGFTVVCDELKQTNKEEYGINTITLTNASLINGGQTQGEIRRYFEENDGAFVENVNDNTNIKIEVFVEKDQHEVHEICVARNSSTNVSDLSKLGNQGYFREMNERMISALGEDSVLQLSETDGGVPTQTLLQILRAMTPKSLKEDTWSKDMVVAYSGKGRCLTDYGKRYESQIESRKDNSTFSDDVLDFYIDFCSIAWTLYAKWIEDKDWIPYWKKGEGAKKIGKYNEQDGSFELTWAIACPLLFGLQEFICETPEGWTYDEPQGFDKKKYMDTIMSEFKDHKYVPQEFAKDKSTYLILRDAVIDSVS